MNPAGITEISYTPTGKRQDMPGVTLKLDANASRHLEPRWLPKLLGLAVPDKESAQPWNEILARNASFSTDFQVVSRLEDLEESH